MEIAKIKEKILGFTFETVLGSKVIASIEDAETVLAQPNAVFVTNEKKITTATNKYPLFMLGATIRDLQKLPEIGVKFTSKYLYDTKTKQLIEIEIAGFDLNKDLLFVNWRNIENDEWKLRDCITAFKSSDYNVLVQTKLVL